MPIPTRGTTSEEGTGGRYDVFLSYDGADRQVVARLAEWLRRNGIEPWWDRWSLTPGSHWQDEIIDGLRASRACAVVLGPGGLGGWAHQEMRVAQNQAAVDSRFRLFMVLLPGAPDPLHPQLAFLRNYTWVDLRAGADDPEGLQDLLTAVTGVRRAREPATTEPGICPYKGLEAFSEEDADLFFGRERDVAVVVEKLRGSRFLAVLGPSGSGKSSLLRAGVVPALRSGAVPGSERWAVAVFTPGARPLATLAAHVTRLVPDTPIQATLDGLSEDRRSLDLAMAGALQDRPEQSVLLVVDQFEEVFTVCPDEAERAAFVANIVHAATVFGGVVRVVLGMRADFYHRCARYSELRSLLADDQVLVGPLDAEGLRRVAEEPARRAGLELEAGLVETIIADVADRPGTLPLVEHMLLELWRRRRGTMLTLEAYVAAGGVRGALARRADALYESFDPDEQQVARRVLLRLVQPGEGGEDSRRRAAVEELVLSERDRPNVEAVVNVLADHRLLTLSRDDVSGALVVDMAHEALIRGWPRLRRWIDERREELRAQRHLTEAAAEWDRAGRRDEDLFGGARLAYWREQDVGDLTDVERTFVERSREVEERDRTARRRRTRLTVGGVLLAVTAIAAVALVGLWQVSRQREAASSQRDVARSQLLVGQAADQAASNPQLASLLSLAAFQLHDSAETHGSLLGSVMHTQGVKRYLPGHAAAVNSVAFSPDGRVLASAGNDGHVTLWDAVEQRRLASLGGHTAGVASVAFSPDGGTLASAGADGKFILWDISRREEVTRFVGHKDQAMSVAFSPDGRMLAAGGIAATGGEGEVLLWDVASRSQVSQFTGPVGLSVAFSSGGRTIASGGLLGQVSLLDTGAGTQSAFPTEASGPVLSIAFSPDGKTLATASGGRQDGPIILWDVGERREREVVDLSGSGGVAFSPNGEMLAFGGFGTELQVRSVPGDEKVALAGHSDRVRSVAFGPDGHTLATGGTEGQLVLWDTRDRLAPGTALGSRDLPVNLSTVFSPSGRTIASIQDRRMVLWDVAAGKASAVLPEDIEPSGGGFPDDERLAVVLRDERTIVFWDIVKGSRVGTVDAGARVHAIASTRDASTLATASADGGVKLWDLSSYRQKTTLDGVGVVNALAFSPDGRFLATAGADERLILWDVRARREVRTLAGHSRRLVHVVFSPDGRLLATAANAEQEVQLWDVARGAEVASIPAETVRHLAFRTDSRLLAVVTFDELLLFEVPEGTPLGTLGHRYTAQVIAFTEDGRSLVTAGQEGIVSYDVDVASWRNRLCRIVGRDLTPEERERYLPGQSRRPVCP